MSKVMVLTDAEPLKHLASAIRDLAEAESALAAQGRDSGQVRALRERLIDRFNDLIGGRENGNGATPASTPASAR